MLCKYIINFFFISFYAMGFVAHRGVGSTDDSPSSVEELELLIDLDLHFNGMSDRLNLRGGVAGNYRSGQVYYGCINYLSVESYLGGEDIVEKLYKKAKIINNVFPSVDIAKHLQRTKICTTEENLIKYNTHFKYGEHRAAIWLPERLKKNDLIKISVFHSSYKNNISEEKVDILVKELLNNYILSESWKTMDDMSIGLFVIFKNLFTNKIDEETSYKLIKKYIPSFPMSEASKLTYLKILLGKKNDQIKSLKKELQNLRSKIDL